MGVWVPAHALAAYLMSYETAMACTNVNMLISRALACTCMHRHGTYVACSSAFTLRSHRCPQFALRCNCCACFVLSTVESVLCSRYGCVFRFENNTSINNPGGAVSVYTATTLHLENVTAVGNKVLGNVPSLSGGAVIALWVGRMPVHFVCSRKPACKHSRIPEPFCLLILDCD